MFERIGLISAQPPTSDRNNTIVSLYLERTSISTSGAMAAVSAFVHHSTLRFLDISGNGLPHNDDAPVTCDDVLSAAVAVDGAAALGSAADVLNESNIEAGDSFAGDAGEGAAYSGAAVAAVAISAGCAGGVEGSDGSGAVVCGAGTDTRAQDGDEATAGSGGDGDRSTSLSACITAALASRGATGLVLEATREQRPFPTRCARGTLPSGHAVEILW